MNETTKNALISIGTYAGTCLATGLTVGLLTNALFRFEFRNLGKTAKKNKK